MLLRMIVGSLMALGVTAGLLFAPTVDYSPGPEEITVAIGDTGLMARVVDPSEPVSSATAATGSVRACVPSISTAGVQFDIAPGDTALVGKGGCVGEGTNFYPYAEPRSFYANAGRCYGLKVNTGTENGSLCGGAYGRWWNIYPGDGFTGSWTAYVRRL